MGEEARAGASAGPSFACFSCHHPHSPAASSLLPGRPLSAGGSGRPSSRPASPVTAPAPSAAPSQPLLQPLQQPQQHQQQLRPASASRCTPSPVAAMLASCAPATSSGGNCSTAGAGDGGGTSGGQLVLPPLPHRDQIASVVSTARSLLAGTAAATTAGAAAAPPATPNPTVAGPAPAEAGCISLPPALGAIQLAADALPTSGNVTNRSGNQGSGEDNSNDDDRALLERVALSPPLRPHGRRHHAHAGGGHHHHHRHHRTTDDNVTSAAAAAAGDSTGGTTTTQGSRDAGSEMRRTRTPPSPQLRSPLPAAVGTAGARDALSAAGLRAGTGVAAAVTAGSRGGTPATATASATAVDDTRMVSTRDFGVCRDDGRGHAACGRNDEKATYLRAHAHIHTCFRSQNKAVLCIVGRLGLAALTSSLFFFFSLSLSLSRPTLISFPRATIPQVDIPHRGCRHPTSPATSSARRHFPHRRLQSCRYRRCARCCCLRHCR